MDTQCSTFFRAQLSKLPVLSRIASVFSSEDDQREAEDAQETRGQHTKDFDGMEHLEESTVFYNHDRNSNEGYGDPNIQERSITTEDEHIRYGLLNPLRKDKISKLLLYNDNITVLDSRKKRSFIDTKESLQDLTNYYEYSGDPVFLQKRAEKVASSLDDMEVMEISNALEHMVDTKYQVDTPSSNTIEGPIDELITSIPELMTTEELHFTPRILNVEEEFSDVLSIEECLDTTLPPSTESTVPSYLLTEISQITEKAYPVVTTLDDLIATAPVHTPYIPESLETDRNFVEVSREVELAEAATAMFTTCKETVEVESNQQPIYVHKLSHDEVKQKLAKLSDQVMYPSEIETMKPGEEVEEEGNVDDIVETAPAVHHTHSATVRCHGVTTKPLKISEECKQNDTEYYVDIVIPYDTDEQQQYIDRFVKREEPANADVLSSPRREQRNGAERRISKESAWPEHREYGSSESTKKELEGLSEWNSEDRRIWNEMKWPTHRIFTKSVVDVFTPTEKDIEDSRDNSEDFEEPSKDNSEDLLVESKELADTDVPTLPSRVQRDEADRQIWKKFARPEHRKYDSELAEKEKEGISEWNSEDRRIWNEMQWPTHRIFTKSVGDVFTPTEKYIEGPRENSEDFEELSKDNSEDLLVKRKEPSHADVPSLLGRVQRHEADSRISKESSRPEHRKYDSSVEKELEGLSEWNSEDRRIWNEMKWPTHRIFTKSIGEVFTPTEKYIEGPRENSEDFEELSKDNPEDLLVKRKEPSHADVPSLSGRVQRHEADSRISKESSRPEHRKYDSSVEKELEGLSEWNSEDRRIWNEMKWPTHRIFTKSVGGVFTPTEINIEGSRENSDFEELSKDNSEDRLVEGGEPKHDDVLSLPRRIQRDEADRQILNEFNWPEHRKYDSLESSEKKLEGISEGDSEDRQIWKEFNWPEHRIYTKSVGEVLTTTEKEIVGSEDRQIWKEFKWPEHREYTESLSGITESGITESDIRELSGENSDDRQIWKEFKWPEHRKYTKSVGGDLATTEEKIEVVSEDNSEEFEELSKDNSGDRQILEEFKWPEHRKYTKSIDEKFIVTEKGIKEETSDDRQIWKEFNWPEHRKYTSGIGGALTTTEIDLDFDSDSAHFAKSSIENSEDRQIWKEFNWPEHRNYEKERISLKGATSSYQSIESNKNLLEKFNVQSKFKEGGDTSKTEEWEKFNFHSSKDNSGFIDVPSKHKVAIPGATNEVPLDESEKLELSLKKIKEEAEGTTSSFAKETSGPHVLETGLWDELHLPFHESAHTKIIPESRLGRGTTEDVDIWNKFKWPDHKEYTTKVTENFPNSVTILWDELPLNDEKTLHFNLSPDGTPVETNKTNEEDTDILQKFNWPEHKEYLEGGGTTKGPAIMETALWDTLHLPFPETGHLEILNISGLVGGSKAEDLETTTTIPELEPIDTTTKGSDLVKEPRHTTKIIEHKVDLQELTSRTYVLEGTDVKTTTDIWEAFQWPSPRTLPKDDLSGTPDQGLGLKEVPGSEDQLEAPSKPIDLDTNITDISIPEVPVPPFPPSDDYEEYLLFPTPSVHGESKTSEDWFNLPLSPDKGTSERLLNLDVFTTGHKRPFWDHVDKKIHHPKTTTTTTEGFPSKQTPRPTKSTTVGERLELIEEIHPDKHPEAHTEPSLRGPIKVAQERTFHTPVRESEDDDNLWDFRVLNEDEVVTFRPKTKPPTQKRTTIYSFKPIGTTPDDWEVFNEPPKEEVTKSLRGTTVAEEKKTTFYVVMTEPTESVEPFEIISETEKAFTFEPPPPMAPPGAVESSTEYYDDEEDKEAISKDYEVFLPAKTELGPQEEVEETTKVTFKPPLGEVEDFETVTFKVTEIAVRSSGAPPAPELVEIRRGRTEENVELVTFRPFESYPTGGVRQEFKSVEKVIEDLKDQNGRPGLIDSLSLETATFRQSKPSVEGEKFGELPSLAEEETVSPLTVIDFWKGDKENILQALSEAPHLDVTILERTGERTTRIIEGDRMITEPYDHRSMSIPFNERLGGSSDILYHINRPYDPNEEARRPPLSELAADFFREQNVLGKIRDPYSVLERPESVEEAELARLGEEGLKSPFTEENPEGDIDTALGEPERLV
ncbi:uncharacterized protein LOC123688562 [Harmonia axyridis]|uniref:uncharacterized protein LOC123688562 n=1 Tax=Harmonia axyridis TaxID=115357 RepID=UPI001E276002|nr:uncharacterized protein LOC123688562 [Harmonia axyridis]